MFRIQYKYISSVQDKAKFANIYLRMRALTSYDVNSSLAYFCLIWPLFIGRLAFSFPDHLATLITSVYCEFDGLTIYSNIHVGFDGFLFVSKA